MKKLFSKETFNSLILGFYLLLCFFLYWTSSELQRTIAHGIIVMLSFIPFTQSTVSTKFIIKCILLFIATIIISLLRNDLSISLIYVFSGPIFAQWIYKSNFNIKILYIQYLLLVTYFVFIFFTTGSLSTAITAASRNFISAIMLFNTVLLIAIIYKQYRKIEILPAIITMFICINAIGRGGIICSIGLFLVVLFWKINSRASKKAKFITGSIIIIGLIGLNSILSYLGGLEQFERFQERGIDDYSRLTLRERYMANMNSTTVLTGYNYHKDYLFKSFQDNPHNSYIRLHANMGILSIIPALLLLNTIIQFTRKNIFLFGLLLILLVRAWTDIICFNNFYDFIIWYFIFLAFDPNKQLT